MALMGNRPAREVSIPSFLIGVAILAAVMAVAGYGWYRMLSGR